MNKIILKFINIHKGFMFIALFTFNFALYAQDNSNFKQVEATGRSILLPENIETSRKRALEDAIYLAALKGGANVNGFSAISSNTVINDQSVIKPTNRVLDFKILSETQNKEYLTIKISAVVGSELSKKNCKIRPINVNLFKGSITVDTNVPSELARYTSLWYNKTYEFISKLPNVNINNFQNRQLNKIILKFINIHKGFMFIALFTFNFALYAQDNSNFKQVEATGRSFLLPENIETSR